LREKAEVISEDNKPQTPVLDEATDADILALLSRRPCTVQGVSAGLGLHVTEAAKRLAALAERQAIVPVQKNGEIFYRIMRTKEKQSFGC
jgi:predicted ArsR family transcriptional regulator